MAAFPQKLSELELMAQSDLTANDLIMVLDVEATDQVGGMAPTGTNKVIRFGDLLTVVTPPDALPGGGSQYDLLMRTAAAGESTWESLANIPAFSNLATRVGTAETNIGTLQTTVASHGTSITNLGTDLSALTTRVGTAETAISALQTTVGGHTTDIGALQTAVSSLQTALAEAQSQILALLAAQTNYIMLESGTPIGSE